LSIQSFHAKHFCAVKYRQKQARLVACLPTSGTDKHASIFGHVLPSFLPVKLFLIHFRLPLLPVRILSLLLLIPPVGLCSPQTPSSRREDTASKATAVYQQGLTALQKGDLPVARARFEKVVQLAPKSPEGHNSLAWVLLAQGEVDLAIGHFRTSVTLKPDFALAHMNLANALARKGDAAGALREAREAVQLAPGDSEVHHTLGRILDVSGNLEEAITELRAAIDLEPQRPELHDDLGTVLVQKGDSQSAASEFSAALRLRPNFAEAHFHLGVLRYRKNRWKRLANICERQRS
jgi:Flp pilus assembly protein TadD